jgi:hypothetical protein
MTKRFIINDLALRLGATQALSTVSAKALKIQIAFDNDFAIFSGTSISVNTLLYQNNDSWPSQCLRSISAEVAVTAGGRAAPIACAPRGAIGPAQASCLPSHQRSDARRAW